MGNKNKNPYQEFEDKGYTVKVYKNWADYQNQKTLAKEKQEKLKQIAQTKKIKKENQLKKDDMEYRNNLIYNPDLKWALKRRELYKQNPDVYKRIAESGGGDWQSVDAKTIYQKAGGPKPTSIIVEEIQKSHKQDKESQDDKQSKIDKAYSKLRDDFNKTLTYSQQGLIYESFDGASDFDTQAFIRNVKDNYLGKNSTLSIEGDGWKQGLENYLLNIFQEDKQRDFYSRIKGKLIAMIQDFERTRRKNL